MDDRALGSAAICFEPMICHKIKIVSSGDFGKNAIDVDLVRTYMTAESQGTSYSGGYSDNSFSSKFAW